MKTISQSLYNSAKRGKHRAGRKDLIKHLEGKRLTRQEAIKAKCFDCNGMGESGICDLKGCSLLPYSQFIEQPEKKIKK